MLRIWCSWIGGNSAITCQQQTLWLLEREKERYWEKEGQCTAPSHISRLSYNFSPHLSMFLCTCVTCTRILRECDQALRHTFLPTFKGLSQFTCTHFVLPFYESQYLNCTIRNLNPYPSGAPFPSHWLTDWMWMQQVGRKCCRVSWCASTHPIRSVTTVASSRRCNTYRISRQFFLRTNRIDGKHLTPFFLSSYSVTLHILSRCFYYKI
jgi:hypothetical protein